MSSSSSAAERNWLLLVSALVAFALGLGLELHRMYVPLEWGDEGYFANAALRILDGQVLYRDFQHNYPPGRMYCLALLMEVFGRDLAVVRVFWCVLHAGAVALALLVARRLMPLPFAALVALAVICNAVHLNKTAELLVASGVLLVVCRVLEGRTSDWAAGAWLGLIGHFRHDTGAFGVGLFVLSLALRVWIDSPELATLWPRLLDRVKRAWPFAVGLLASVAPFAIYLAAEGALGQALWDLSFAGVAANRALSLPFPALVQEWSLQGLWQALWSIEALYYIPIVVYSTSLVIALRRLVASNPSLAAAHLLLASLLGVALFSQVLVRTDPGHLNKAYLPAHILSMFLVWTAYQNLRLAGRTRGSLATIGLLALVIIAAAMPLRQIIANGDSYGSPLRVLRGVDEFKLVEMPHGRLAISARRAKDFRQMARVLKKYSYAGNDEYLLAFPAGAILNLLFDYRNPLAFDVLRPGELGGNDQAVLDQILKRLAETNPRFLVHIAENTNEAIEAEIVKYAIKRGYSALPAGRLTLMVRPEDGAQVPR